MSTNTTTTITVTPAQFQELVAAATAQVLAQLSAPAPKARTARTRKAPAAPRKAAVKVTQPKAAPKPAPRTTKGAQSRETLSRKDWNRTLTAKARLAGKVAGVSVYSQVTSAWDDVQELRGLGMSPDEVLHAMRERMTSPHAA